MKKTRYDSEIQKIQIEQMRHILEKEIYHLTERLVATESRFKDVNHLLLRTEKEIDSYKIQRQVKLNEFLTSNGITEDDLVVQKDFIFVLTPFHNEFLDDFATIKNVCSNVGLRCVRGDEQYFSGDIFPNILKQICKASLIIANINGRNPNVLYELGIVQALDKPVILISKSSNKIPADIKSKRFIIYKTEEELVLNLKSELIKIFINQ
ncbi:MAG: hypothetical protein RR444_08975 [Oscillospiraceae bacterium]